MKITWVKQNSVNTLKFKTRVIYLEGKGGFMFLVEVLKKCVAGNALIKFSAAPFEDDVQVKGPLDTLGSDPSYYLLYVIFPTLCH